MASSPSSTFLLLSILGFLAISANARPGVHFHPCRTIFISSFTISQNPNPTLLIDQNPSRFLSIFTEFKDFHPIHSLDVFVDLDRRPFFDSESSAFQLPRSIDSEYPQIPLEKQQRPVVPFGSFGVSSIRDRTKDILSVVVALLFGVGCGALTSATMYLAWSLITNRYETRDGGDFSDSDVDDYDEIPSPKKMGYEKVPLDAKAVDAGAVPAQAKEAV